MLGHRSGQSLRKLERFFQSPIRHLSFNNQQIVKNLLGKQDRGLKQIGLWNSFIQPFLSIWEWSRYDSLNPPRAAGRDPGDYLSQ